MSNLNESIRDWIQITQPDFEILDGVDLVTMGESEDLIPPFIAIYETGSQPYKQGDVQLPGVTVYEITVELHTIPADDGTTLVDDQAMRTAVYDIIGNRDAIDWMTGRNLWDVFDIRMDGGTSTAADGRRVTKWTLDIIAAPAS